MSDKEEKRRKEVNTSGAGMTHSNHTGPCFICLYTDCTFTEILHSEAC